MAGAYTGYDLWASVPGLLVEVWTESPKPCRCQPFVTELCNRNGGKSLYPTERIFKPHFLGSMRQLQDMLGRVGKSSPW